MAPTTARLVYNLVNKGPRGGIDKVNYYVVGFLGWQTHPGLVIKHTRGGRAESAELNQESAPFGQQLALHSTRPARSLSLTWLIQIWSRQLGSKCRGY